MSIRAAQLLQLEANTGHKFQDIKRLERALTHASVSSPNCKNYERLEFFGDRVLGLVIAEMLCCNFKNASEGELAIRLNGLVKAETCAEIAHELGLADMVITGSDVKALDKKRLMNMYADVLEALIAVIYIDGGMEAVRPFIEKYWSDRATMQGAARRDPKTQLQEWAHRNKASQPCYIVIKRDGPDHEPLFFISLNIDGFEPSIGQGRSKRAAEQHAAKNFLIREGGWEANEEA